MRIENSIFKYILNILNIFYIFLLFSIRIKVLIFYVIYLFVFVLWHYTQQEDFFDQYESGLITLLIKNTSTCVATASTCLIEA